MFIDWNPYLKSVISILSIDLVQIKAIVHALLDPCNVLIVAYFKPMVEHRLHPPLTMKQVEANLTPEEFGHKKISLPLQIVDDVRVHLLKELEHLFEVPTGWGGA